VCVCVCVCVLLPEEIRWDLRFADQVFLLSLIVVNPHIPRDEILTLMDPSKRTPNFCFYAGDPRQHAVEWGGCDRTKMIAPLQNRSDLGDMRILTRNNRLTQNEYNARMHTSEFCLIVCGDTPTSRSLASSMLQGCIPLRIGSRLRGRCEPPCKAGWGWTVTHGLVHLPFEDKIDWNLFPELDEAAFTENAGVVLEDFLRATDAEQKAEMRAVMKQTQLAWVYGWGDPVTSTEFGQAAAYAWDSLVSVLVKKHRG